MPMRVLLSLLLLIAGSAFGAQSGDVNGSGRYRQITEDAAIWSRIGNDVVRVGYLREGQILSVTPGNGDYDEFGFGHGVGFIDRGHLAPVQGNKRVKDSLGELNKPISNQNLITWKDTPLYSDADASSPQVGVLAENLRYPVLNKLKDRLNQTWYQIRLGERLAWVSSLDAQPDNGIPVITYHHILRDEENTRFRHTSTTTSVRAFSNQMTWLRDMGYTTLTLYQLESYLRNQANVPAKSVVITFDDGLKSVSRYAYPILHEYGFKATAFIISSRIKDHPQTWDPKSLQFMSISELRGIQDTFDVQSHTHFLHRVDALGHPILLSRNYHNILMDFKHSRRALTQFNPRLFYLAYPFGGYDTTAVIAAGAAGFHMAMSTVKGKVKPGDDMFFLKRVYILRTDSLETMSRLISNQPQG